MNKNKVVAVVGAGPGLGASVAQRFAKEGYTIALIARTQSKLEEIQKSIEALGQRALPVSADVTSESDLESAFNQITEDGGNIEALIYNAGDFKMQSVLDIDPEGFKRSWEINCMGAFLSSKLVLPSMIENKRGTIIFTGATASKRGSSMFSRLAVGKFGLRALAQSMAREFGPKGVHIAHVVIDGIIATPFYIENQPDRDPQTLLSPDSIAEQYLQLHIQDRTSWTLELDLRPSAEKF